MANNRSTGLGRYRSNHGQACEECGTSYMRLHSHSGRMICGKCFGRIDPVGWTDYQAWTDTARGQLSLSEWLGNGRPTTYSTIDAVAKKLHPDFACTTCGDVMAWTSLDGRYRCTNINCRHEA